MSESTTAAKRSLIKKLAAVMKEVSKIPKNGTNSFHHYRYVVESDLVEAIRDKLADRHVFITSSTKAIETIELGKPNRQGELVSTKIGVLRVEYTFHDGESGETLTMESVGEIDQDGGKGLYKALTGAMKYFLMKNFLVATGDDPEEANPPVKEAAPRPAARPVVKAPAKAPASVAPATAAQLAEIARLAKELQMDVQKDIYSKMKIESPSFDQAAAIYKRLREKLTKELDDAAKKNS